MELKRNIHTSDELLLTVTDLAELTSKKKLSVLGLDVRLVAEDISRRMCLTFDKTTCTFIATESPAWEPNVEMLFDGETGQLKAITLMEDR